MALLDYSYNINKSYYCEPNELYYSSSRNINAQKLVQAAEKPSFKDKLMIFKCINFDEILDLKYHCNDYYLHLKYKTAEITKSSILCFEKANQIEDICKYYSDLYQLNKKTIPVKNSFIFKKLLINYFLIFLFWGFLLYFSTISESEFIKNPNGFNEYLIYGLQWISKGIRTIGVFILLGFIFVSSILQFKKIKKTYHTNYIFAKFI